MKKRLWQQIAIIKTYAISVYQYGCYRLFQNAKQNTDKAIFIDINSHVFKRYLYGFIKFLHLAGYSIYINPTLRLFYEMRNEKWEALLFIERLVIIGKPPHSKAVVHVTELNLSPDYFSSLHDTSQPFYHVPMMQHPFMYHQGWWNQPLVQHPRKHSLFMAGNFDETMYKSFAEEKLFPILSRLEVYTFLQRKKRLYHLANLQELINFITNSVDQKIVLIDRRQMDVPMDELRNALSRFAFFFALPGVEMPYSHNLIEAMSCGCIPFIQEAYAEMMIPKLQNGTNAVTFTTIGDVENKIALLFALSNDETNRMTEEVFAYYNRYLTPEKVVAAMEEIKFSKLYLQAEHGSVELLKKRKQVNTAL